MAIVSLAGTRPGIPQMGPSLIAGEIPEPPRVDAAAVFLQDLDTGQVLLDVDPDAPRPVASLTKVMTALLALEEADPGDAVTIGPNATAAGGNVLGLSLGERIPLLDLLYAALLESANDAALAVAEHVGGTEDGFVARMNQRAAGLRLWHTEFASATGLDNDGRSTAREVAALFAVAFRHKPFARIEGTQSYTVASASGNRILDNRNLLLGTYDGVIGGKTGFTTPAGYCLVAAAERDGVRLVAVILGHSEPAFDAAAALFDYGFGAFGRLPLLQPGVGVGGMMVQGRMVLAVAGGSLSTLIPLERQGDVDVRFTPFPGLVLPIDEGQAVGAIRVELDGVLLGTIVAVAAEAVSPGPPPQPAPSVSPAGQGWVASVFDILAAMARVVADRFL